MNSTRTALWIVLLISLFGDLIVFILSTFMLSHKKSITILTRYATPFAAGALLSAAFLDFLKEGVEHYDPLIVLMSALEGLIGFFLLEGWLHWFHHHSKEMYESDNEHKQNADPIALLAAGGNLLHNFVDGAAIAGAFLISKDAGIITTIAVAMHEIPREIADSGYLLKRGMKRLKIIAVHGAAIVVTAIGTILFYLTASQNDGLLAVLLGATAGFFIYIAASDIIPSINSQRNHKTRLINIEVALVIIGALFVGSAILITHMFIE